MLNGEEVLGKRRSSLANSPKNKLCVVQLKMKGMKIDGHFKACILKVKSEHGCMSRKKAPWQRLEGKGRKPRAVQENNADRLFESINADKCASFSLDQQGMAYMTG
ncbi:hypothetical protein [Pseudomonas sp. CYM-20-01]|jgi:hypothetical protein|uniref:hypothetical protein n=1 Tax=Pseudomonas sp. CYM-20-01 TaxID=2870750 RepID=UPI0020C12F0F|nr:hypothetical protein [Pseudomonas sp. CYM-20-01]